MSDYRVTPALAEQWVAQYPLGPNGVPVPVKPFPKVTTQPDQPATPEVET